MKKIKILIIIVLLSIPIYNVKANELEDNLNNLRIEIKNMKNNFENINLLNAKYPIGSIYISVSSQNPSETLGGTWESYAQGRTLIGMGSNGVTNYQTISSTGGNSKTTLTIANLPAHTHTIIPKGTISSTFTGSNSNTSDSGVHSHSIDFKQTSTEASGYGLGESANGYGGFADRVIILSQNQYARTTSTNTNHSHTLTPSGTVASTFTGTKANTNNNGSTTSINVQNPYITVYIWKRIG